MSEASALYLFWEGFEPEQNELDVSQTLWLRLRTTARARYGGCPQPRAIIHETHDRWLRERGSFARQCLLILDL